MFTPQRKGWSPTPRLAADGQDYGSVLVRSRGKLAAVDEVLPPPPQDSLGENGDNAAGGSRELEDWRSFREAGFLDKSELERRDREALAARTSELEKELHDYQYNMGLLLIEKEEWLSKYEEIRQGLTEAKEILKREQAAHLVALSELQKREENMRKALGVEKQCVADLEKALREIHAEIAEVKFTSDKKLADARALETSIEERCLEAEGKLHSADAKLAEASRKSSEIDRKLEGVESREREFQREFSSLNAERKTHEKDLAEQRGHLRDWEKKLQEGQKRLDNEQKFLNEREGRANGAEIFLKKKEEEIEEAQRVIEFRKNSLKEKEDAVSTILRALAAKEKEADIKEKNLAKKEKDLLAIEEKLNARERVEIQKLLDDHKAILDAKKQEFEMEMEEKRKSFDEELKNKQEAVEQVKIGIERLEEQVVKREQTLESKMEELKIKEKDLGVKSKSLKKWEESMKVDEKKLQEEKKQLGKDVQELVVSKDGLESLKAAVEAEKQQITVEMKNLKLTKEEREQHLLLQLKLKQEIDEYMRFKESVLKESESLRQEKEKFEREWEVLDEKRMALEAELKQVNDERNRFEKWRQREDERLKREALELRANVQRELENLRLKKEAFESAMEHERSEARELLKKERADIVRELELQKHELEMDMQKKQENMEKKLQERESEFDSRRENELSQLKSSSNLNESKNWKLRMEQDRLEREKEELFMYRKKLETDQLEIQKDIDTLRMLSRNLKDQREEFIKDREGFLVLAEHCKICRNCGVPISELEPFGLQPIREIEDAGNVRLPSLADGYLVEHAEGRNTEISPRSAGSQSVGRMSWLQKCSRLFILSPGKMVDNSAEGQAEKYISFGARCDRVASEVEADCELAPSYGVANESFDTLKAQYDNGAKENEQSERLYRAGDELEPSLGITDNSIDILRIHSNNNISGKDGEPIIPPLDEQNKIEIDNDSQIQPSKQRRRQPGRRAGPRTIKRTHSVKAVVEDAKVILGEASEVKKDGHPHGGAKGSPNINEESQGDSVHASQLETGARPKRRLARTDGPTTSDVDAGSSEARSESVSKGGRRKRHQTSASSMQTPGEKRYNLRRSTIAGTVAAAQATRDQTKGLKVGSHRQSPESEILKHDAGGEGTSTHRLTVAPSSGFVGGIKETAHMLEKTDVGSVEEVQEISSQKVVRFEIETEEARVECEDNIDAKSLEFSERSMEDGDEVDGAAAAVTKTPSGSQDEEDDDDVAEEDSEKHNASIGKKIWTFFTT